MQKKYRDRNGRCIAILFRSIGVRGRCDSPDFQEYNGAQNDYTQTLSLGKCFPNCTGHLLHKAFWQELFCGIWAPPQGTFCEHQVHTRILWDLNFPVAPHLLHIRTVCELQSTPPKLPTGLLLFQQLSRQ